MRFFPFIFLPLLKVLRVCFFCESFLFFIFLPCTVFTKCSLVDPSFISGRVCLKVLTWHSGSLCTSVFGSLSKDQVCSLGGSFPAHSPCMVYCVMKQSCPRDRSSWESCNTSLCVTSPLILSCHPTENIFNAIRTSFNSGLNILGSTSGEIGIYPF